MSTIPPTNCPSNCASNYTSNRASNCPTNYTSNRKRIKLWHRLGLIAALFLLSRPALAVDLKLPDGHATLRVGISQTTIAEYHADFDKFTGDEPDKFFDVKNRTNLVLMHGTTTFNLRFDGYWVGGAQDGSSHRSATTLEKISLSSIQRSFDLTAGDFYIRIGRGIALDLTKVDELARDMTLRGARVQVRVGPVEVMGFGGWVNPLDVDDAIEEPRRLPSDIVAGGELKARVARVAILSLHYVGSRLEDRDGGDGTANHVLGVTTNLPNLAGKVGVYGEFNYLSRVQNGQISKGMAAYVSSTGNFGPLALLAEFKFYRRFLLRNDFGRQPGMSSRYEAAPFIYNRPPTLSHTSQEIINNSHIYGPRLRLDLRLNKVELHASYGYFSRTEEAIPIHDAFGGIYISQKRWKAELSGGYRADTRTDPTSGQKLVDYSKIYVAGKVNVQVYRGHSMELQGEFRKLEKTGHGWTDIFLNVSYRPSPYFAGGVTYEHSSEFSADDTDQIRGRTDFGGVTATINFTGTSYFRFMGGSTRGGLRCVDGFCREFPPFIGAKGELVLQF